MLQFIGMQDASEEMRSIFEPEYLAFAVIRRICELQYGKRTHLYFFGMFVKEEKHCGGGKSQGTESKQEGTAKSL